MSQVAILSKSSITDWFGQPANPSNPPVNQARMFYRSSDDTFHVIDSNGVDLLSSGGGGVTSVAGKTGAVTLVEGDIAGLVTDLASINAKLAKTQTVRFGPTACLTGSMQGPYSINFPTPFADGNYTVQATATCAEAAGTLALAAIVVVGQIRPQATPGNGVIVYLTNGDSITHSVTVNLTVIHD